MRRSSILISDVICLSCWGLLGVPIVIWTGYQVYDKWNAQWLIKRRRSMVFISYTLAASLVLFELPFHILSDIVKHDHVMESFSHIALFMSIFWLAISALRMWLLYFDHQYGKSLSTKKWKILLDKNHANTDWYLQNRQKYGNPIWLIKCIAIPVVMIYFTIYLIIYWFVHTRRIVCYITSLIPFTAGMIYGWIMWRKFPQFQDVWKVKAELKMTFIVGATFLIIWSITIFICLLFLGNSYRYITTEIIFGFCLAMYFMIIYPQRTMTKAEEPSELKTSVNVNVSHNKIVYWSQVVQSKNGYESFANFLESEFSVENILFITEYVQFKQRLMQVEGLKEKITTMELTYNVNFAEGVPMSAITKDFDETRIEESFYECSSKLYDKYIDSTQAMMEVNISSQLRFTLMSLFKNNKEKSIEKILSLMEQAVKQISVLMNDSYSRFQRNKVFNSLKQTKTLKMLFNENEQNV